MKTLILALALGVGAGLPALAQQDEKPRNDADHRVPVAEATVDADTILIPKDAYMKVQQKLHDQGVVLAPSDVKSDDGLKKFQREHSLPQSGKLDIPTLNALGFSGIVAISPKVDGANLFDGQGKMERQLPAGFPTGTPVVGHGTDPAAIVYLGSGAIGKIEGQLADRGYLDRGIVQKGMALVHTKVTTKFIEALTAFQRAEGIEPANGILDVKTLAKFNDLDLKVVVSDRMDLKPATVGSPVK